MRKRRFGLVTGRRGFGSVRVARGVLPSFHGFRHTAASEAIAAGESAEEVSWQLGHKTSNITRAVYVQEVKNAERTARRRARMEARYGTALEAAVRGGGEADAAAAGADVFDVRAKRAEAE